MTTIFPGGRKVLPRRPLRRSSSQPPSRDTATCRYPRLHPRDIVIDHSWLPGAATPGRRILRNTALQLGAQESGTDVKDAPHLPATAF